MAENNSSMNSFKDEDHDVATTMTHGEGDVYG